MSFRGLDLKSSYTSLRQKGFGRRGRVGRRAEGYSECGGIVLMPDRRRTDHLSNC